MQNSIGWAYLMGGGGGGRSRETGTRVPLRTRDVPPSQQLEPTLLSSAHAHSKREMSGDWRVD